MYIRYTKTTEDSPAVWGNGFKEYNKSIRLGIFGRVFSLSWVWAIDPFGRYTTTPFTSNRMNFTAVLWRLGYVRLHINKKTKKRI